MEDNKKKILKLLKQHFNLDEFRSSQEEIILHTLKGGNSLVLMPTGMGKSLCFQLPALALPGLTVVISPLISLMKDQVDSLTARGIDAAYINSSLGSGEREARYRNVASGKYRILYVSPERFRKDEFLRSIGEREVSLLVVDEAHCVSQWGHDFRPDYSRIAHFMEVLNHPPLMALTATATPTVQKDIIAKTGLDPEHVRVFDEGISRPNLTLIVEDPVDESEKFDLILQYLERVKGSVIVYFNLIKGIEKFAYFLQMEGVKFSVYHGQLPPEKRKRVQREFIKGKDMLMLATNAFGMGVDKEDIRMVVHAETPDSLESYYQEIGRAGRDGKLSLCVLMYEQADLAVQMEFLKWKNPDSAFIGKVYRHLVSLGGALNSYTYEDIQEELVYKDRSDHRLSTVLSLFDRYGVTTGSLETLNLEVTGELSPDLINEEFLSLKKNMDHQRLVDMVNYAKTGECRREYIHRYFGVSFDTCGNCDNCAQ